MKNDGDLTEICLNIDEIGHDHICKFYLNDLEIILGMTVKLILRWGCNMNRMARCCCEEAGIEVEGLPVKHLVCHCDNCKRRTGSAFGISAYFENSQIIRYVGETKVYEKSSQFGLQKRHFCGICGTTLYATLSDFPELTFIAGGCFTENPLPDPDRAISQGDCVYKWVTLPNHWNLEYD